MPDLRNKITHGWALGDEFMVGSHKHKSCSDHNGSWPFHSEMTYYVIDFSENEHGLLLHAINENGEKVQILAAFTQRVKNLDPKLPEWF